MQSFSSIVPLLYVLWAGLPLVLAIFIFFIKIFSAGNEPYWYRNISKWALILILSGTIAISFERFALSRDVVKDFVIKHLIAVDSARLLIFPLSIIVFYAFGLVYALFKKPDMNYRFQKEVGGSSGLGLILGFVLMLFACFYGTSPREKIDSLRKQTNNAETVLPSLPQIGRVDKVMRSLDPIADEFDAVYNEVIDSVKDIKNDLLKKEYSQNITNSGFNLVNYKKYRDIIVEKAISHDITPNLVLAIVAAESKFNPNYEATDGGYGLMNVTANMAQQLNIPDFRTPETNIEVGCRVLKAQLQHFGENNVELAIAAYHFGTSKIDNNKKLISSDQSVMDYVNNVLRIKQKIDAQR